MEIIHATPAKGKFLSQITALLEKCELRWDGACENTVAAMEDGVVVATGSRRENVLQCICVSPDRQSEGLSAIIVTELVEDAYARGFEHLFIVTKPSSERMFTAFGFYPVASVADAVLLENVRDGARGFVEKLARPSDPCKVNGAIVANCNPFTNGHLYLAEYAAKECDCLHLFILSENKSEFPAKTRMELVRAATAHIPNLLVHPGGPYLISGATFPDYFIKDPARVKEMSCALDIAVFAERFALPMRVTRRYVGTEPACPVTAEYNEQLRKLLPGYGIDLIEIPRRESEGKPISASRVRVLLTEGNLRAIRELVPPATYAYLETHGGHERKLL